MVIQGFGVELGNIKQKVKNAGWEKLLEHLRDHLLAFLSEQLFHAEPFLQRRYALKLIVLQEDFSEVWKLVFVIDELPFIHW